ncbi:hypothetical protein RM96_29440 [Cupriavidus sp. IDO]|nr:hypothetical protein RM96_29440 [Cupriavidus sp. IDO]
MGATMAESAANEKPFTMAEGCLVCCRGALRELKLANLRCLRPFRALPDFEFDFGAFIKGFESGALDFRVMGK